MRKSSRNGKTIQLFSGLSALLTRNVPDKHRVGLGFGKLILSDVIKSSAKSRGSRIIAKGIGKNGLDDIFQAVLTPETKAGEETYRF